MLKDEQNIIENELLYTIPEILHTFTNWSSLLSVRKD